VIVPALHTSTFPSGQLGLISTAGCLLATIILVLFCHGAVSHLAECVQELFNIERAAAVAIGALEGYLREGSARCGWEG
jgi:hypothetical protein